MYGIIKTRSRGDVLDYEKAKRCCHARSALYREAHPEQRFWKHSLKPLDERVPDEWKPATDWREYDPREHGDAFEAMA